MQLHIHLPGLSRIEANNRHFIRAMTRSSFDAPDVELLIFSLASDVCFIHLNDASERCGDVGWHEGAEVMDCALCSLEARASFLGDTPLGTLSKKRRSDNLPCLFVDPKSRNRICLVTKFSTTPLTLTFLTTDRPGPTKGTDRTGSFCHIWWQTYSFPQEKSLL